MRTDLALESRTAVKELSGIREITENKEGIEITRIDVLEQQAAKILDKPLGRYVTLKATPEDFMDSERRETIAKLLSLELCAMSKQAKSFMVVGLGNRYIVADALGTKTAEYILVTRHIHMHMLDILPENTPVTSAFCANVLGMTGMETAEVVSALVGKIEPDVVVFIDSLAAASTAHIGCVIQCNDSGIAPGAGVGNYRTMLTESLLKVPVIAVGVPTVVSAETIARESGATHENEPKRSDLIVAPKDIDAVIRDLSRVLSDAVNLMIFGEQYRGLEKLLR
ncbi:MAG: GPR endopeptidase [Clostridia bacterium]|nr:GPR endopeptidase [Clostridia bacterium]